MIFIIVSHKEISYTELRRVTTISRMSSKSNSNKRQKTVSVSPVKQPSNPFKAIETSIDKLDSMTAAKNVEQKIHKLMITLFKKKEELREEQKELAWERGKKSGLNYRGPNAISCECGNRVNPDGEYVGICGGCGANDDEEDPNAFILETYGILQCADCLGTCTVCDASICRKCSFECHDDTLCLECNSEYLKRKNGKEGETEEKKKSNPKTRWKCDYCEKANFLTYDEACAHEDKCKRKAVNPNDKAAHSRAARFMYD